MGAGPCRAGGVPDPAEVAAPALHEEVARRDCARCRRSGFEESGGGVLPGRAPGRPDGPLRRELFEEAAGLYRAARRAGLTVRSGADCLIAACAIRHGLPVLHNDRDFDLLARVSPLESRRLGAR